MDGVKITIENGKLNVPDQPIIPFIEGDGTGVDIWPASKHVIDAAVEKAYGGSKKIAWKEVLAGEKAFNATGEWLPEETLSAFREYLVGIKGPLTTPVGGGIRSLNVALRQKLDLYACVRPVRWFSGTPSPVKDPSTTDMVIFRENTEGLYAGLQFYDKRLGISDSIARITEKGCYRIVKAAFEYARKNNRKMVTLVHKANIIKEEERELIINF